MLSIRKFVGCVKVAASIGGVLMLGIASTTASASAPVGHGPGGIGSLANATHSTTPILSAACTTALQAIRQAFVDDRAEDADERAQGTEPDSAADQAEDAAEIAHFKALFANARTACAPAIATAVKAHTTTVAAARSAQCTTAVQALKTKLKAIWSQGTRPTGAQLAEVRSLSAAARAACGWTWRP